MFLLKREALLLLALLVASMSHQAAFSAPATCSTAKMKEVLQPATSKKKSVVVNCHLSLKASDVVTKQLILKGNESSGAQINCQGATLNGRSGTVNAGTDMIRIQSSLVNKKWQRPENIVVRGCKIYGSARIIGMSRNGEGAKLRTSSRSAGHTQRAQQAAPRNITFDHIEFIAQGRIPLYFSPGVTYSKVTYSNFSGTSTSVAIYLDTESYGNTIQNNKIATRTNKRELMAIDSSAGNKVINNYFMNAEKGGIYLYRNCGEGGTIRHQPPQKNQISNNAFQYNSSRYINPSIWLGSRQGARWHCRDDRGYRLGSSMSNLDYAQHNVISNNQFLRMEPRHVIRVNDQPNSIVNNRLVYQLTIDKVTAITSKAPVKINAKKPIDSNKIVWRSSVNQAEPRKLVSLPFGCSVKGNNNGCSGIVRCPSGTSVSAVKAACNLESGKVLKAHVNAVPWNITWILRASEKVWEGNCQIANVNAQRGQARLNSLIGQRQLSFHCQERDRNGGDCDVKGVVQCK